MIRRYEPRDLEELLDVWHDASRIAHDFLPDTFFEQERRNIPEKYLPIAETWVYTVRVSETAGRVVGFVSMLGDEVGAIFVDPRQQGQGVGRALMDHVREPRERLEVEVFEANTIGRGFYDSYGFELVERKSHDETGQPLLRLRLEGAAPGESRVGPE